MGAPEVSDAEFRAAVGRLRAPGMGTEVVAPLLAQLVRLHRPRRVLEIGMGYTTPFLAAALAENEREADAEAVALAAKSRAHLGSGADLDDIWAYTEPPLLAPSFYLEPYRPRFVAVDNLSIEASSAGRVLDVLGDLGLAERVEVVNADLHDCAGLLPDDLFPIDLAWVDAWECLYFFEHFWERINPDGGLVVMHYLMTYPEGEAILEYFAKVQHSRPGELEMVNLLEPHKLGQNSITVLRRTGAVRPRPYGGPGGALRYHPGLRREAATQAGLGGG
ncbi:MULTISPECIES: class I SAM-dependent methyltransferase [unclassified Streptomyces]|uniref:class I SAM-dependent methyltransferase n=1 Tax=unclassified Streptomyces TaxID=2593676 RepID=UPI00342E0FFC